MLARRARIPAALALSLVAAGAGQQAAAAPPAFKFPTGRINYNMDGKGTKGTVLLAWADGGKTFRQDMSMVSSMSGKTTMVNMWVICDGKYMYMHNPQMGKTVNRMKLTPEMLKNANGGLGMIAAPASKGKLLGKGTVAGKPCRIHELPQGQGAKMWVWEGIPLKMETGPKSPVATTMAATKVETGITHKPNTFKVPAGLAVKDLNIPRPGAPAPTGKGARK
jgi:hypothetical protein